MKYALKNREPIPDNCFHEAAYDYQNFNHR